MHLSFVARHVVVDLLIIAHLDVPAPQGIENLEWLLHTISTIQIVDDLKEMLLLFCKQN